MPIELTNEEKKLLAIACSYAINNYQQQKFHMTALIAAPGSEGTHQELIAEYDKVIKSYQELRIKLTNQIKS